MGYGAGGNRRVKKRRIRFVKVTDLVKLSTEF